MRSGRSGRAGVALAAVVLLLAWPAGALAQCWGQEAAKEKFANPRLLAETKEAADHVGDPQQRLVDLRYEADPAGRGAYRKGHIPGAVYLAWGDLDDVAANRQGFPMPPAKAEALFSRLGIDPTVHVVAYDDAGGLLASRLVYVLHFFGHTRASVLNGGITKWTKEGRPLATDEPKVAPRKFVAKPNPDLIVTADWLKKNLKEKPFALVDSRTATEYAGTYEDPEIKAKGHIPGAAHLDWATTITPEQTFKSPEELKKLFAGAGAKPGTSVVTYCRTGVRAAHNWFVAKLLGFADVRNYDGSWVDWGNDPSAPVNR
ncbi:MAG: sulfurtransferase [candidate division NC10 bacterium]|nr:sulfurtransferase [candidate division NC10 bacterium]